MRSRRQIPTLFQALMHPARLEILEILRQDEECVCHMKAKLGYRQAYISQQLMILREAGLVKVRRDGWNIFYRVVEPRVFDLIDQARQIVGEPLKPVQHRARSTPCPCPKCAASKVSAAAQEDASCQNF